MATAVLERNEVRSEWNHSCTPQCPNPCPAAASAIEVPEIDTVAPVAA